MACFLDLKSIICLVGAVFPHTHLVPTDKKTPKTREMNHFCVCFPRFPDFSRACMDAPSPAFRLVASPWGKQQGGPGGGAYCKSMQVPHVPYPTYLGVGVLCASPGSTCSALSRQPPPSPSFLPQQHTHTPSVYSGLGSKLKNWVRTWGKVGPKCSPLMQLLYTTYLGI